MENHIIRDSGDGAFEVVKLTCDDEGNFFDEEIVETYSLD